MKRTVVEQGSVLEPFTLDALEGPVHVPDPAGRRTLLMFFTEANTPTCSTQLTSIAAEADLLGEIDAVAVCVSTDPPEELRRFREQQGLQAVRLAADADGMLARRFGVYDETSGRAHRAAFVVDGEGRVLLANPWYNPMNGDQLAAAFAALGLDVA